MANKNKPLTINLTPKLNLKGKMSKKGADMTARIYAIATLIASAGITIALLIKAIAPNGLL